ncbi:MAG: hypothetical protein WAX69_11890, partial [Victivallales bacterium]
VIETPTRMLMLKGNIATHESGRIRSGSLADTHAVDTSAGNLKIKGDVEFNENGKIKIAHLSGPQFTDTPLGKLKIKGDIWFHKNGRIQIICLNQKLQDSSRIFDEGTIIGWDEDGNFLGEVVYDSAVEKFFPKKIKWNQPDR